jgi:uncharacterized integral membrane protein
VKRALHWIILGPIFVVAILFAIGNVNSVPIGLWPLVGYIEAPLSFIALFFLVIGFLFGAVVAWFSGGKKRQRNRELAERNSELTRRVEELRREQASFEARLRDPDESPRQISGPRR